MFRKIIPLVILILTNLSYSQWFQQFSGVTNDLNSVFILNTNYGFVVGNSGTFVKTTDGGINWSPSILNPGEDFNDVSFISPNEGTIVGNGGLILRTTDGGSTWNIIASGVTDNLYSVSFNGMNGIIGGSSQTILSSTNGGVSWNIAQTGFFGGGFWGASMLSPQIGFVAGENSIFQPLLGKTTDSGQTWDFNSFYLNSNEGRATGVDFTDQLTGYVSASVWDGRGAISKTTDNGNNWITTLFNNPLWGIDFPISNASLIGYVVGDAGTILKTNNAGDSWQQQQSGTSLKLNNVYFIDLDNGFAVGEAGIILNTTNGGIPVELTNFTAKLNGNTVSLNWSTATETNNLGFEVKRKTDEDWITIGFVEGRGTTTQTQSYSFLDDLGNFSPGIISYRLKQVDFDGSFKYSDVIEVNFNSVPNEFSLSQNFPNPFNPITKIKYGIPISPPLLKGESEAGGFITLKVYDILGREVMTLINEVKQPGNYDISFDGSEFSSGVYFYEMRAGSFSEVKQFLLLK